MAEEIDQSTEAGSASAEAPAAQAQAVDLDSIMAAFSGELDKRFGGITSLIDKKVSPLAQELAELKTAGMSPEEREQLEERAAQQRYEDLERENELLKLRASKPDAVDFLMDLDKAETFEDQLELIEKRFGKRAADQVEAAVEAASDEATPAVDPNNAPRDPRPGIQAAMEGGQMNDAMAEEILKAAGKRSLASFRRTSEE